MGANEAGPVTGVPTAVPAFVGYTEKAERDGNSVFRKPVRIRSLHDFEAIFGGGAPASLLHPSLWLFYANGGGEAFVVSAGRLRAGSRPHLKDLRKTLAVLETQPGPTLLVVPDAVLLPRSGYAAFLRDVLAHCARLRDRFAILDVRGGGAAELGGQEVRRLLDDFRRDVGGPSSDEASFGAAYFPFLRALSSLGEEIIVPAGGAVAGALAKTDATKGVWTAPANISLTSVLKPTVRIDDRQQADFAATPEGKAVNLLRELAGRGTVIWGASTLGADDYRYIQVRRTLIYIEQSIKQWLDQLDLEPDDADTWTTVTARISDFLHHLWTQGGLRGTKPEQAFRVVCGLGSTMTQEDIDNGVLNVQIGVAPLRPAEYVEIYIQQVMGGRRGDPD